MAERAEYSVSGEVTFENFLAREQVRQGGLPFEPIITESHQFTLTVSNACWWMRVTPSYPAQFAYKEASFDGKQLYFLLSFVTSGPPTAATGGNVAEGRVCDNQSVVYDVLAHEMGPIWLMFASSESWTRTTNNLVVPATLVGLHELQDYYKKPFMMRAHWTLQGAFPQLPVYVAYLDDGYVKTDPQFQDYRREPPFDRGFTNTVFRVLSFTNINGAELPMAGQLDTFRPDPRGRQELIHFTQYRVTLRTWENTSKSASFIPALPGPTTINDSRVFSRVGSYVQVSTSWPKLEQVTNAPQFKQEAELYRTSAKLSPGPTSAKGRVAAGVAVLLVVTIPLALMAYRAINKRSS